MHAFNYMPDTYMHTHTETDVCVQAYRRDDVKGSFSCSQHNFVSLTHTHTHAHTHTHMNKSAKYDNFAQPYTYMCKHTVVAMSKGHSAAVSIILSPKWRSVLDAARRSAYTYTVETVFFVCQLV
jgi:hypothetical protein